MLHFRRSASGFARDGDNCDAEPDPGRVVHLALVTQAHLDTSNCWPGGEREAVLLDPAWLGSMRRIYLRGFCRDFTNELIR